MIFPWVWNLLPGNRFAKLVLLVMILVLVALILFLLVFPALEILITPTPVLGAVEFNSTFHSNFH
jgi:hypothetical protein